MAPIPFDHDIVATPCARESLCAFRNLFDLAAVGNAEIELNGWRLVRVNQKLCDLTGYSEAELLQKTFTDLTHPDDRAASIAVAQKVMAEGGDEWRLEKRYVRKDGTARWSHCIGRLVRDDQGNGLHLIATIEDITERKQAEEALSDSEARYRRLVELCPDAVFVHADGRILYANPACVRFFRAQNMEEVLARSPLDLVHPDYRALVQQRIQSALKSDVPNPTIEQKWVTFRGEARDLDVVGASVRWEGRAALMVIGHDITERKRAEQALREADRHKDEFLAVLAHELRNPLAPIRTAAQIVGIKGRENPQLEWAAGLIERQVQHLSQVVRDLLDVSQVAKGKIALQIENVDLKTIAWRAVEMHRAAIEMKKHTLRVDLPPEPLPVEGDSSRLLQVLSNLLSNAVKYTANGGIIYLTAEHQGGRVALSIRDNGVGIAQEELPSIFDMFVKRNRTEEGLGIGLALVKKIIELHGGQVSATSQGLDRGAAFTLILPIRGGAGAGDALVSQSPAPAHGVRGRRIVIVDDNRDAADSLAFLLKELGHEVRTAYDGQGALVAAVDFEPDAAILDIALPGEDGCQIARRFRGHARLGRVLLIALSGHGRQSDRQKSLQAGFDCHLLKPVDITELAAILNGPIEAANRVHQ